MPRLRCQKEQSAAPPAIVPKRKGLISMTFFTVCEAIQKEKKATKIQETLAN
jgi:hypothetical protein